jgi:ribonuclease HII
MPDLSLEKAHGGPAGVCGIDEAGRGPLAGPVYAAAVILPEDPPRGFYAKIDDSKSLSPEAREEAAHLIRACCVFGIGSASVAEIDEINILQATFLAMRRAHAALGAPAHTALIDGNKAPGLSPCWERTVVKGDTLSLSIAAASILAKTARDSLMLELDAVHPGYGWRRNFGYSTKDHLEAIKSLGITEHHRRTFRPICELFATSI